VKRSRRPDDGPGPLFARAAEAREEPVADKPVSDIVREGLDALFIGINPGLMSARLGHHFANPSNGFWRLLFESGLTSKRLTPERERELLDEGLGLTNVVDRETPGVAELTRADMENGRRKLAEVIARYRPAAVVFIGITGYRAFLGKAAGAILCGEQEARIGGARVFVLPNPSGRNAHFSYAEMLELYRGVARALKGGAGGAS
jgi:double-stranded uracil-DNA glycosylase